MPIQERLRGLSPDDRLILGAAVALLVSSFLPGYGAQLFGNGVSGWGAEGWAIFAILGGVGCGVVVGLRMLGVLDLAASEPPILLGLAGISTASLLVRVLTVWELISLGLIIAAGAIALIALAAVARVQGRTLLPAATGPRPPGGSVKDTLDRLQKQPITGATVVAWFRRMVGVRPLIGAALAGGLMFVPSHSLFTSAWTSIGMVAIMAGFRLAARPLAPLFAVFGRIPRPIGIALGIGLPMLLSYGHLQGSAAGMEVSSMQSAMWFSTIISYVFLQGAMAGQQARR